ncbi:hypothetical protein K3152_13185 [Qipengyuania sp. 1NDH17]|uniref:Uncharacterized protein n=1 Tax=Qipengyuania polymorpha TaxID=2867234 RepID=A0ABS7J565_9SPHN|nr:hypothetical protein [Qipengyuania polymorpha]MBX7459204.1 hypothetical protein [Qipengyuania polymorpha]
MPFYSRFNAAGGLADFWNEWRKPTPHRWPILFAAMCMTGTLMFWLTKERYYYPPEQPKVTYITTYAEGRTDEEIIASNIANQRLKDEREAEAKARLERRRELYKQVGRATGLDVDQMEAEIRAQEAEEAAAEDARFAPRTRTSETSESTDDSE